MRSVEEIYKDLLSAFAGRAGFTPEAGCDLAVRLWAAAAQMQALEIQADWVLDQSFPQTAQGVWLDRHGAMRGLKRLPAARAEGPGTVNVYVAGENGLPGEALLRGLAEEFREKREIAVQVKVLAPEVRRVNVSVAVAPKEGEDGEAVLESVRQAVADFFGGRLLGRPVRLAELGNRLYALEGVENYRFTAPEADVPADSTALPVLGTLEVTELREAEHV